MIITIIYSTPIRPCPNQNMMGNGNTKGIEQRLNIHRVIQLLLHWLFRSSLPSCILPPISVSIVILALIAVVGQSCLINFLLLYPLFFPNGPPCWCFLTYSLLRVFFCRTMRNDGYLYNIIGSLVVVGTGKGTLLPVLTSTPTSRGKLLLKKRTMCTISTLIVAI